MALSEKQLQEMKKNATHTGNTVKHMGRIQLDGLFAKYAGRSVQYDEYTNQDRVPFTFYWFASNLSAFQQIIEKRKDVDRKIEKDIVDSLFKFNNDGEQVIYGQRRRPLPEVVTYDENSKYSVIIDIMHAEGTDSATGQPFSRYYGKVINVLPTTDENRQYLAFTDQEVSALLAGTIATGEEQPQIENK